MPFVPAVKGRLAKVPVVTDPKLIVTLPSTSGAAPFTFFTAPSISAKGILATVVKAFVPFPLM